MNTPTIRTIVLPFLLTGGILVCTAQTSPAAETLCGGWSEASATNAEVIAAAKFAVKAQAAKIALVTLVPTHQPATIALVEILGAQQQVVAGMNYRLRLKVKVDEKDREAEAVVWWQAWRKPDPYRLTSWTWKSRTQKEIGRKQPVSQSVVKMPNDNLQTPPIDYSNFDSLSDHDKEMVVWHLFDKRDFGKPEHKPICRALLATQGKFANANGTSWTLEAIALTEKYGWKDFTDLIQAIRQQPDNIWANQASFGCLRSFSGKPVPADIVRNTTILYQAGVRDSNITGEALDAAKRELVSSPDQEAVLAYCVTVAGWHSGKGGTNRGRTAAVEVIRAMPKEMVEAELAKLKGKNEVDWIVSHLGTNAQQAVPNGEFVLEVTRGCSHPPAARPGDGLDERLYTANTNGIQYKVEFSSDGRTVNINTPKSLIGTLTSDAGNVRTYAVNSFAGGRFVVSGTDTKCEAELTIYGSGVPIINSVRGHLVRSTSK